MVELNLHELGRSGGGSRKLKIRSRVDDVSRAEVQQRRFPVSRLFRLSSLADLLYSEVSAESDCERNYLVFLPRYSRYLDVDAP